ncbi:hypothetical protein WA026_011345 [Henosepilachna vigintioctopunctata]|uniref:CHK kinase-like domain-containing protein n=1 Tax=Henosepilachna vigintioctopunctata TaxID=420089 RepID=A0AAW1TV72_9CUCU
MYKSKENIKNGTNLLEERENKENYNRRGSNDSDSSIYYDVEEDIIPEETVRARSIEAEGVLKLNNKTLSICESDNQTNSGINSEPNENLPKLHDEEKESTCSTEVSTDEQVQSSLYQPRPLDVPKESSASLQRPDQSDLSSKFLNSETQLANCANLTRELFMYNVVFPQFNLFGIEKYYPILENVVRPLDYQEGSSQKYKMWRRVDPMDMTHMILVLSSCGKWHGSVMAFREQRPKMFEEFSKKLYNIMQKYLTNDEVMKTITKNYEKVIYMLSGIGRKDLAEKYKKKAGVLGDILLGNNIKHPVIALHADFWVDSIMFKEQGCNSSKPEMFFSNFQLPMIDSPMRDLSYIIYCYGDQNLFEDFDFLMHAYYASLSESMLKLGNNPDQIFPYETMKREWKRYGMFGALMMLLEVVDETEDDFWESRGTDQDDKKNIHKLYNKRIADIFIHYGENFL